MADVLRYYLDTEFYEDGRTIDLISIGIVCEDGREFYAVNSDAELHRVSPWVRQHVLPQLPPYGSSAWMPSKAIRDAVQAFIELPFKPLLGSPITESLTKPKLPKLQLWGYYADYDWVVLCQLFGTMMDLPSYMPKFCMDLKQLAVECGNPPLPIQEEAGKHNALDDARWNRRVHAFLESFRQERE